MPKIDREGIFKVKAGSETGVEESEKGGVAIVLKSVATHILEGNEWVDFDYGMEIWTRIWIIKNDGSANENGFKTARDVLGWDGKLSSCGTSSAWVVPACQISVDEEEYQGKKRFKGAWVNPIDYTPDSKPKTLTADKISALEARYGATIRAMMGNKPTGAPAPTTKAPPLPIANKPPPPPPPPAKTAAKPVHGTKERAWLNFTASAATFENPMPADMLSEQWSGIMGRMFPDKTEDQLTPADWYKFESEGPSQLVPF